MCVFTYSLYSHCPLPFSTLLFPPQSQSLEYVWYTCLDLYFLVKHTSFCVLVYFQVTQIHDSMRLCSRPFSVSSFFTQCCLFKPHPCCWCWFIASYSCIEDSGMHLPQFIGPLPMMHSGLDLIPCHHNQHHSTQSHSQDLCKCCFGSIFPGVGVLGHRMYIYLVWQPTALQDDSTSLCPYQCRQICHLPPLWYVALSYFLIFARLIGVKWHLIILIGISLISNQCKHLCIDLVNIQVSNSLNSNLSPSCNFLQGFLSLFLLICKISLCNL